TVTGAAGLDDPGGLVHPRAYPDPRGQVRGGGERGHVPAGLRDDDLSSAAADPRDRVEVVDVLVVPTHQLRDPGVQGGDDRVEVVNLVQVMPAHERVVAGERAVQGLLQRRYRRSGRSYGPESPSDGRG